MNRALTLPLIFIFAGSSHAHVVPKDTHDRTISVRLQNANAADRVKVTITYRLELDELTAADDMKPYRDEIDPGLFANQARRFHAEFARKFADIIAANLDVKTGKQPLTLKLIDSKQTLREDQGPDKGKSLGHLRCTFVFETEFPMTLGTNDLRVWEGNYDGDEGLIHISFANDTKLRVTKTTAVDLEFSKLHFSLRPADFNQKVRTLIVEFDQGVETNPTVVEKQEKPEPAPSVEASAHDDSFLQTFRDLRESNSGLAIMLLVFVVLGAAHALTPGHGKTLVAAYLVGEHGTMWHALTLGLVTTLTHTGVVLAIAVALFFLPESTSGQARQAIQMGLGLVLGISITCLGFWLLLQRLSGRADHIHLSTGESSKSKKRLGWWGIIVLGVNGGLIPCWDAVAILVAVIGSSEFWMALPALLAFSAGLAGVLVAIGILVVQFRNFAGSKWGKGRLVRSLPLVSAILVTGMGLYLSIVSIRQP